MKVIDLKICLEDYRVRAIPPSTLKIDDNGNKVIDYDNPKSYYGEIPEYKIDSEGEFILDVFGQKQIKTIDINLKETTISTKGRHDPCVGIRAVPVGEAMLATTIADHCLRYF